jgi:hypothetical protein
MCCEIRKLENRIQDEFGRAWNAAQVSEAERNGTLQGNLHWAGTDHLKVCPVDTQGIACYVMTSLLYPTLGFLIFDSPFGACGPALQFAQRVTGVWGSATWMIVCGCDRCQPYEQGRQPWVHKSHEGCPEEFDSPDMYRGICEKKARKARVQEFLAAIEASCKEHGITDIVIAKPPKELTLSGVTVVDWVDFPAKVDRWRFAAAFGEIALVPKATAGPVEAPFSEIFDRR